MLNLLRLETRYFPTRSFQVTARVRGFYDAVYDFQRIDNIAPRTNPRVILSADLTDEELAALQISNLRGINRLQKDIELRELYVDLTQPNFDFRLGKQIVRWGVLEGARITDEIHPLDLQEFILREVQDRYIPLWLARMNFYRGETRTEFLWIPDVQPHKPAPPGSEWEQLQTLENLDTPPRTLANSEVALRVSRPFGQWDVAFSYFYHWDDFPSAFRNFVPNVQFGESPDVNFKPVLTRNNTFGSAFSKSFSTLVFNAELAYVLGKRFGTRLGTFNPRTGGVEIIDPLSFGEKKLNFLKYGMGADFTIFGIDMTLMGVQQYVIDHNSSIIQDEFDTFFSYFLRDTFFSERLVLQMLTLYFQNDQEFLIRPRMDYQINSKVKFSLGADIFEGEIGGPLPGEFNFIGFFKNNDRIYFEVSYGF